ncbi:hypothetical protein D3C73_1067270 [compost metagenome]
MRLQAGKQQLLAHRCACLVLEQPVARLVMPYQGMAAHRQPVLTGKRRQLVRPAEAVDLLLRMQTFEFHLILGGNAVEMMCKQLFLGADRQRIDRRPDFEGTGEYRLQCRFGKAMFPAIPTHIDG